MHHLPLSWAFLNLAKLVELDPASCHALRRIASLWTLSCLTLTPHMVPCLRPPSPVPRWRRRCR